ncbi:MAG: hypothetical protein EOO15_22940 [Chitinophagaceae bacterium]|nr:MAG: hypothetical protein EOO15_22940 [Chitinophagaceae bacterium]
MVAAALLAVLAVGCAPLQQTTGDNDYYEPDPRVSSAPTRIYVEDPYRPGRQILVERDPLSGRYYPVSSTYGTYGGVTNAPYGVYDPYYGRGGYSSDPYYGRPRNRNRDAYRNNPRPAQTPQQREQVRQQGERSRQNAADQILGRKQ